jgi:hypothetical protein
MFSTVVRLSILQVLVSLLDHDYMVLLWDGEIWTTQGVLIPVV